MIEISGLVIIEDYISSEKEEELLSKIKVSRLVIPHGERNSIQRYGSKIPYNSRVKSDKIPEHFRSLCEKLVLDGILKEEPDSVTVNEYRKGQGITYHYDSKKSGPTIVVLSLLGEAIMGMKKENYEQFYNIKPRTLIKISGDARWDWRHSILPVLQDRISIVFRKGTQ